MIRDRDRKRIPSGDIPEFLTLANKADPRLESKGGILSVFNRISSV